MTGTSSVAERPVYETLLQNRSVTSNGMRYAVPIMGQYVMTASTSTPSYVSALPKNLDIFSEVERGLENPAIGDDQRMFARKLILALKESLLRNYRQSYMDLPYSNLHLSLLEDSSVLIEWTYLNLRAGFSIEHDIDESSYYVLIRDKTDGVSTIVPEYGPLTNDNVGTVAAKVVARISEKL